MRNNERMQLHKLYVGYELLYSRFKYRNLISNYLKNVAIGLDFSD